MHEICQEVASAKEKDEIIAKDLYLRIDGKDYSITVTTQEHAHLYRSEDRSETSAFIVEDLSDTEKICKLLSETPFDELRSFLILQEES